MLLIDDFGTVGTGGVAFSVWFSVACIDSIACLILVSSSFFSIIALCNILLVAVIPFSACTSIVVKFTSEN